jgi:hypothetical protein
VIVNAHVGTRLPPLDFHGKEGVGSSSPSEGLQNPRSVTRCSLPSDRKRTHRSFSYAFRMRRRMPGSKHSPAAFVAAARPTIFSTLEEEIGLSRAEVLASLLPDRGAVMAGDFGEILSRPVATRHPSPRRPQIARRIVFAGFPPRAPP